MEYFDKFFLDIIRNHYADFKGRVSRKTYWMFILFTSIIGVLIVAVSFLLGMGNNATFISNIYGLCLWLPSISLGVRRMHDIGKSGWWVLISLIPVIGIFWYVYLAIQPSNSDSNF